MSAFVLKIIAVVTMTCDHFSDLVFKNISFLNYIGRIAFPIFAYQISEGYIHTHNLKKYFIKLGIFALISQIPFMLFISSFSKGFHLNIFFTLLLGLTSITIYEKLNQVKCTTNSTHIILQILGICIAFVISALASFTKCDYGYFGVLIIFFFYFFRNKRFLMNTTFIILAIMHYGENMLFSSMSNTYLWLTVFTIVPLFFINLYNHKKGKDTKYFLYIFYPLHLLIFYIIHLITL